MSGVDDILYPSTGPFFTTPGFTTRVITTVKAGHQLFILICSRRYSVGLISSRRYSVHTFTCTVPILGFKVKSWVSLTLWDLTFL